MPCKVRTLESLWDLWIVLPDDDVRDFDEERRRWIQKRRPHGGLLDSVDSWHQGSELDFWQERREIALKLFKQIETTLIQASDFLKTCRPLRAPFWFVRCGPFGTYGRKEELLKELQEEGFLSLHQWTPAQRDVALLVGCYKKSSQFGGSAAWPFEIVHRVSSDLDASVIEEAVSEQHPWRSSFPPKFYLFGTHLWKLSEQERFEAPEELRLLFLDAIDKERRKFERLRRKFAGEAGKPIHERQPIPEDEQMFVWRRDEGRCIKCGSQERLEFDHVIPVSKGGSNTARNIQLLCERCNRRKGANI